MYKCRDGEQSADNFLTLMDDDLIAGEGEQISGGGEEEKKKKFKL